MNQWVLNQWMNDLTILSYLAGVTVRTLGLAAIAWVVMTLCRVKSPAVRHAVWSMVTAGMLVLAAASGALPGVPVRVLPARAAVAAPIVMTMPVAAALPMRAPLHPAPRPFPWDTAAGPIYLAGLMAFAGRLAYAYLLTCKLVRASRPVAGLADGVYESECISVPLTVGWLRPRILLPKGWDAWSAEKLDAVLIHERTHIARADWAIAVLAGVNRCVFWFHPLAWWLERELTTLAEQACDDASLSQVASRESYAQTLVDMAAAVRGGEGRVVWEAMAMAKAAEVRLRVDRILDEGRQIFPGLTRGRWFMVAVCGLPLIYLVAVARPARVRAQEAAPAPAQVRSQGSAPAPQSSSRTTRGEVDSEVKLARERLDRIEEQLIRFKMENMGRLPEQFQANVAQLNNYQMMVTGANEAISRLQQQRLMVETQLQNNYTNLSYYNSLVEQRVPGDAGAQSQKQVRNEYLNQLNARIMTMQSEIAALQEQLSPNHPTIKRAQASLASLEKKRQDAEQEDLERKAAAPGALLEFGQKQQAQRAVMDLTASNNMLKAEMQNLNVQLDDKVRQMEQLNKVIAQYQSRVESSPKLEGQYAALLRDQAMARERLEELKRMPAPSSGPSLISRRDPEYTPQAKQARIQGTVELSVTIGTDGVARDVQVIRRLDAGLDRKAVECVRAWRFRPASRDGQPVTAFATVEVKFRLP